MEKGSVTVIGSYNVGLFLKGKRLPGSGETVIGDAFHEGGGGKGSNQAIAASCLGADVTFIGRIGKDKYGDDALSIYNRYGVSSRYIAVDSELHTGISVILIDENGANMISVVPGANFRLSSGDIDAAEDVLKKSAIVGFQLESDFQVVEYGLKKCSGLGIPTLLDPAPARALPEDLFPHVTYMKPNEHEAAVITGIPVVDRESAVSAGNWLRERGVRNVLITLGDKGVVLVNGDGHSWFPSMSVKAVDTTGAGDCFSGAFMTALTGGMNTEDSIRLAVCAAGLSVMKIGVVESLPAREELAAVLKEQGLGRLIG